MQTRSFYTLMQHWVNDNLLSYFLIRVTLYQIGAHTVEYLFIYVRQQSSEHGGSVFCFLNSAFNMYSEVSMLFKVYRFCLLHISQPISCRIPDSLPVPFDKILYLISNSYNLLIEFKRQIGRIASRLSNTFPHFFISTNLDIFHSSGKFVSPTIHSALLISNLTFY